MVINIATPTGGDSYHGACVVPDLAAQLERREQPRRLQRDLAGLPARLLVQRADQERQGLVLRVRPLHLPQRRHQPDRAAGDRPAQGRARLRAVRQRGARLRLRRQRHRAAERQAQAVRRGPVRQPAPGRQRRDAGRPLRESAVRRRRLLAATELGLDARSSTPACRCRTTTRDRTTISSGSAVCPRRCRRSNVYQRVQTATRRHAQRQYAARHAQRRGLAQPHPGAQEHHQPRRQLLPSNAWGSHDLQAGTYLQPNAARPGPTPTTPTTASRPRTPCSATRTTRRSATVPFHRRYVGTSTTERRPHQLHRRRRLRVLHPGSVGADQPPLDLARPARRVDCRAGQAVRRADAGVVELRAAHRRRLRADRRSEARRAGELGPGDRHPERRLLRQRRQQRVATRDEYDVNRDGVFETVRATPASTTLSANQTRDPDKHQGYVQEWIVGYRTQLPGAVTFDAQLRRPDLQGSPGERRDQPDLRRADVVARPRRSDAEQHHALDQQPAGTGSSITASSSRSRSRRSGLNLISTYTRVWDYVDGTWQPNDPASIIQPDAFPNDGGIGTVRGSGANSLSDRHPQPLVAEAPVPRRRELACAVGLNVSTLLTLQSGIPSGPLVTTIAAPDPQYGPATLVINGRTVTQPALDDDALRVCDARRGAAVDAVAEDVERPRRPGSSRWAAVRRSRSTSTSSTSPTPAPASSSSAATTSPAPTSASFRTSRRRARVSSRFA